VIGMLLGDMPHKRTPAQCRAVEVFEGAWAAMVGRNVLKNRWVNSLELDTTYWHDQMAPVSNTVVDVASKSKRL
jgi:hypothetical protein